MTTISAKIIADSLSLDGIRLTTMQLRYPRCIHSEFLTHRVFSRNASSSRAIPVERLIQDVLDDPFVPLHWGKNQKGMQADEECNSRILGMLGGEDEYPLLDREVAWLVARDNAVAVAQRFSEAGYHKQLVNRILEPYAHINVVATSTEWTNFLWLRDHKDAEPHIAILAREVKAAMNASEPELLQPGQWHLPYVTDFEHDFVYEATGGVDMLDALRKLSVARCASVSYKTVDGQEMTIERATALYDKLITAEPLHASPTEHQATPDHPYAAMDSSSHYSGWSNPKLHGNLRGWRQFRKTLPNENVTS